MSDADDARRLKHLGKMKANVVSDEDSEEDPIQDPAIREKIDSLVASALSGLSNQHPYLEAIASENENPRLLVLGLYLGLLKTDALQKHGICKFCFSDMANTTKNQLRRWTDKLSFHLWKCEDTYSPGFWRCPCCGQMVQCGDPDPKFPLSPDEIEAIEADLVAHRDDCYQKTLVKLGLKPQDDDDDTDDDELPKANSDDDDAPIEVEEAEVDSDAGKGETSNPLQVLSFVLSSSFSQLSSVSKSSFGSGYLRLSVATRLAGAQRALRRLFCPICFFLSKDDKCSKSQREGDDDVRFK